ncbi:MAG: TIGR01212 family radical SAM protein [Lachnospiraceae bacterium]|nr:TIGR01212 family radical SAM protein [Lachnospiraceae bacterium]
MDDYFYSFAEYCKKNFGRRLFKVALDAGMTCPVRDGKIDTRGCIFCDAGGSGDFAIKYDGSVCFADVLAKTCKDNRLFDRYVLSKLSKGAAPGDFIAYFQAYTNTYAPIDKLRRLFGAALSDELFAGISIATRPDCIDMEVINLLAELKREHPDKFIWVELGLQTIHEESAEYIRRGYPLSVFEECMKMLNSIDVLVTVHLILGLPGESAQDMYESVLYLNDKGVCSVKLQLLHVLKGTDLCRDYLAGKFKTLTFDEYTDIVCGCIGRLDKRIILQRLTGDGAGELLVAPVWSKDKLKVLNEIRHKCKVKGIFQGCLL